MRARLYQEPWINSYAVATDAGPGIEDIDPRVSVGKTYDFPRVNTQSLTDQGKLIGIGDIDVPVGVL